MLLGVLVAGLGVSAYLVLDKGVGSNPASKLGSLFESGSDPAKGREQALAAARTFVQRFNTYGPDMLETDGTMPEYSAVGELMTAKFAKIFKDNAGYAAQVVKDTGIDRKGTVYAVGVASIDNDSSELLVAGIVNFSYPDPKKTGERIEFAPLRFRYQVSLVKSGGSWKVDDLDDLDDELPSFGEASIPQGAPSSDPSGQPSGSPSGDPSADPSTDPSPTTSGTGE
ncbi:hypothetical protein ASD81_15400 [Nocardioides sp. Root614]|nr:hypothetical protein ASD81_15400 [Nocardioides sp. Root614]KRA87508.1 hypothetical protein ASD84_15670 [Nocardioides sp. Root682]